ADRNRSHWSTSKTPSYTKSVSWQHHPTADGKPISVFGWFDVPATLADAGAQADFAGALHFWLAWSVVVLSVMHGFMALKHHFIDKDDTLKRMLGKSSSDYGV
ncbi:cytochrome b, partial [Escherichia coli]|uniref:cytochrome b n=1 Tax=Escherichia coli TaxID=562 RepID=UPI001FF6B4C2